MTSSTFHWPKQATDSNQSPLLIGNSYKFTRYRVSVQIGTASGDHLLITLLFDSGEFDKESVAQLWDFKKIFKLPICSLEDSR